MYMYRLMIVKSDKQIQLYYFERIRVEIRSIRKKRAQVLFARNCTLQLFNKYGTVLNSQFVHPNFILDRKLHTCSCCMVYFLSKYTLKSNLISWIYSFARFHTWVMSSTLAWEFIFLHFIIILKYFLVVKYCKIFNWPNASEKKN